MPPRARLALREPPSDPSVLSSGPVHELDSLVRCCLRRYPRPWYFGNSGYNRYDLTADPDFGTCHTASDGIGALREVLGPDWGIGDVVPRTFLDERRLWDLRPDPSHDDDTTPTADLEDDHWDQFGLTSEIFTTDEYGLVQRWAAAFRTAGYHGLKVSLRLALGHARYGVALFGPRGAQTGDPRFSAETPRDMDDAFAADFIKATGIAVGDPPSAAAMGILA